MSGKKQDNSTRKQIRFGAMLERINFARGKEPLSSWVKRACDEKIKRDKS